MDISITTMIAANFSGTSLLFDLIGGEKHEALLPIITSLPELKIIALAIDDNLPEQVVMCARLGCHGIIPRDATLDEAVSIISAAERGEAMIRPRMAADMMRALAEPAAIEKSGRTECLTRREREICSLVAEGLTNKEIAIEVNRSVGTVKNHVRSILTKLELPRRGAVPAYLNGPGRVQSSR